MKQGLHSATIFVLLLLFSGAKEYSYEGGQVSANYLLKDASGDCSLIKIEGIYKKDRTFSDSNYLLVYVHIGVKGHYDLQSDTINGYSFSSAGNFSDSGTTQLKLLAKGKPIAPGANVFTLRFGSSDCQVTVLIQDSVPTAVAATDPDHFPLTANSHWTYDDLTFPGYAIVNTIILDTAIGSFIYKRTDEFRDFYPATNQRFYTKAGLDYFRFASVSNFTSALNFAPSIYDDFNFLKEGLTTGTSWSSKIYTGRTTLTTQIKSLRYDFTCLDADASLTVNNKFFYSHLQNSNDSFGSGSRRTASTHRRGSYLLLCERRRTRLAGIFQRRFAPSGTGNK